MTKKLLFGMAVGAALLTSCSADDPVINNGEGGNVTFTVSVPDEILTRSKFDDGSKATQLEYAVYDAGDAHLAGLDGRTTLVNGKADVSLNLATGKSYTVVFWASAGEDSPYKFDTESGKMTVVSPDRLTANSETGDAFFAAKSFTLEGAQREGVELRRPFAQVNIATSDLADFRNAGGNLTLSGMKVNSYSTLNLLNGKVEGEPMAWTFTPAAIVNTELETPSADTQILLTTNFILIGDEKEVVNITWSSDNDAAGRETVEFGSVPVQRNYRTNIYGTLLTNPAAYEVEINAKFNDEDHNYLNYDNDPNYTKVSEGAYVSEDNQTLVATSAEGLIYLAQEEIKGGQTLKLGADIDFAGKEVPAIMAKWDPESKPAPCFDGDGHTLKNVDLGENKALFGGNLDSAWKGDIKNLNIEGFTAEPTQKFSGLVSNLYGDMENVHLKDVVIKSTNARVGALIGIHNMGHMKNCSIENVEIVGTWSVGGMIGGIVNGVDGNRDTPPARYYENLILKNVRVTSTDSDEAYKAYFGVLSGDIYMNNIQFINCKMIDCMDNLIINVPDNPFTFNGVLFEKEQAAYYTE